MKILTRIIGLLISLICIGHISYAQRVGIETTTPDSTLSIANKVEIGGTQGDIVFHDDLASITFPATQLPNSPMIYMFNTGVNNADRMLLAHSPQFPGYGLQYRDITDQFHFLGNGQSVFSLSVQSGIGRAALGDAAIHPDYTFSIETDTENRVIYAINNTNTSSVTHGIFASNQGDGSGPKRGGLFKATGGSGTNIGMMATASGSSEENIAIYGFAIGENAKAAHFDAGEVVVDENLSVGTSLVVGSNALIGTDLKVGTSLSIGTLTQANGYMLNVNGKIIGEELRIQDMENWPDYVFKPDYTLMSLEEVESHIEENSHLPDLPAAVEIEANGFDSGEMHRLSIQKIEEITLYLIQLNKENEQLKRNLESISAELNSMQSQLQILNSKL